MSDENKVIEIKTYFARDFPKCEIITKPISQSVYAPYLFEIIDNYTLVSRIIIGRSLWDDRKVLSKFSELGLADNIKNNIGKKAIVLNDKIVFEQI